MGADLIGYLVKGPKVITDKQVQKAANTLLKIVAERRGRGVTFCVNCEEEVLIEDDEPTTCSTCGADLDGQELDGIETKEEAVAFVRKFVNDWPPDWRDSTWRYDPDNPKEILVFAGELSWGDTPQGGGYEYLDHLMKSGIAHLLGIR